MDNTLSTKEWFYLDLWTCDLEINRDHLLIEGNPCTKFGIDQVKGSKDRPTYRPTDRHTDRQLQNNMPPFSRGHKNTTEKKPLDFTSNNTECYNEPFSLDKLSESLKNYHDTVVDPDHINYQFLKYLPKSCNEFLLQLSNVLWERGQFPVSWIQSTVIPIPKPGKDNTDPNEEKSKQAHIPHAPTLLENAVYNEWQYQA